MKKEKILLWVAYRIPRKLLYWIGIRIWAIATTGKYSDAVASELTVVDALKRIAQPEQLVKAQERASKEEIFVRHIQQHLKDLQIEGKVLCKICGKDIDEIAEEKEVEE